MLSASLYKLLTIGAILTAVPVLAVCGDKGTPPVEALSPEDSTQGTPTQGPPTQGPPSAGAHEPSGMTLITERTFSAKGEEGWYDENNARYTIIQDSSAPKSPSAVGQMRYPAGFGAGASPAVAEEHMGSRYNTIYVNYWIKLSSNWVGHESTANKTLCLWSNDQPGTVTETFGSGRGRLVPGVAVQGGENVALKPNLVDVEFTRGVWHQFELIATLSTGTLDWWFDGVQVAHYTGRRIGGNTWGILQWCPVWGGTGGSVPAEQFMWMDHLRVSGK
jgi:hypothetical protein